MLSPQQQQEPDRQWVIEIFRDVRDKWERSALNRHPPGGESVYLEHELEWCLETLRVAKQRYTDFNWNKNFYRIRNLKTKEIIPGAVLGL